MNEEEKTIIKDIIMNNIEPIFAQLEIIDSNKEVDKVLYAAVSTMIEVYELNKGMTKDQLEDEGTVYAHIPFDQLRYVKVLILNSLSPKVVYSDDHEVMRKERDDSRQISLEELHEWINGKLR